MDLSVSSGGSVYAVHDADDVADAGGRRRSALGGEVDNSVHIFFHVYHVSVTFLPSNLDLD